MRSVALKEARTESTSEPKEAEELHLEESQQRPTSAGQTAAADEEEILALAWLLYWVDQGCGDVGDLSGPRRTKILGWGLI
jgi:hypothetical protein